MARRRSEPLKAITLTFGLIVAWLFLPAGFRAFMHVSFYEIQAPSWNAASHIRDLQTFWGARAHSKKDLIEASIDLARLNAAYRVAQQTNEGLQREIAELENILNIPPMPRHRVEVARVTRRELNAWWQQLTIRKGRDYNIPVGAAVIFSEGVVGRVKEVHETTSVIELISSHAFRMAATFEGDTRPVTYQGGSLGSFGSVHGNVRDVPSDIHASEGVSKRLVASRLGGVFPEGLTIGHVTSLAPDANGLFTEGEVQLNERLLDIREVAVLVPIEITVREAPQNEENGYVF